MVCYSAKGNPESWVSGNRKGGESPRAVYLVFWQEWPMIEQWVSAGVRGWDTTRRQENKVYRRHGLDSVLMDTWMRFTDIHLKDLMSILCAKIHDMNNVTQYHTVKLFKELARMILNSTLQVTQASFELAILSLILLLSGNYRPVPPSLMRKYYFEPFRPSLKYVQNHSYFY